MHSNMCHFLSKSSQYREFYQVPDHYFHTVMSSLK
jgi:hypothetical protein